MDRDQELESLKSRVSVLEKYMSDRKLQQITFPLDNKSVDILNKYFIRDIGNVFFTNVGGTLFRYILLKQGDKTEVVNSRTTLIRYTVDSSTNVLTMGQDIVNLKRGSFANDSQVYVMSSDSVPAPLSEGVPYYVIDANSDGSQFKLSLTLGGAAIDITNTGTGEQYIEPF